jgi:colanic acid/amylovoran biosynthesis glycosyltransferase
MIEMPTVLIFKETILPPSETFILAQMRALVRFNPFLVGLEPTRKGLSPDKPALLLSPRASKAADYRAKLYRRTGFAPAFHSKVKRLRPDLIHAHFASGGKTLLPLEKLLRLPFIVTLHGGSDVPIQKPQMGTYRELGDRATLFLCVSDFIRRQAVDAGYPPEKLIVHYIGVDRTLFTLTHPPAATENVLFVGRLVEMKGCEYLLRAMQVVQAARPATELTIVGDGPLRPQLETLANELRVRCKFLGVQPPAAIRDLLQKARIFSLPSVTTADGHVEGLGIVLIEAQAMGIPVVSTLHAGLMEAVADGVTGTLVPERDSDALAGALLGLLNDPGLWQRYHLATQEHIDRQFDLRKQTALLEDIYTGQLDAAS